jgi:hypothetical protein
LNSPVDNLGGYKWFTLWSSAGLFSALSLNIFCAAELGYDYDIYFVQRRKVSNFDFVNFIPKFSNAVFLL